MDIGFRTDIGNYRETNQDAYFVSDKQEIPLFIISDGMGGHKAGEVASKMAIDIIKEEIFDEVDAEKIEENKLINLIKKAIETANIEIFNTSKRKEEYSGMGTTVTMAYVLKNKVFIGQIGDSRAYLFRGDKLIQLTEDHSLVAELLKKGSITKEEAERHPQKNIITRAVGTENTIDIDVVVEELYREDIILLCTDGLTNMVEDNQIKRILLKEKDVQTTCNELVDLANKNGGFDNITVIAVKIV